MLIDVYIITLLFITGLVFGKLLIIVGNVFPLKKKHFSICDCDHNYKLKYLIPIYSYLRIKNKCPYCKQKLPILYPVLELFTAIVYSLSYSIYGWSYEMISLIIITSLLVVIFTSDIKYYIINDTPLLVSSILILLLKFIFFGLQAFYLSLTSGVLIFALIYTFRIFGNKFFHRESLGGGDVKLCGFFGICLGIKLAILAIIVGALITFPKAIYYAISNKNKEIPFGPYLITGLFIVFLFQDEISTFINLIIK